MGIRAHVQVRQPEYGNAFLSSWVDDKFSSFLTDNDIRFYSGDEGIVQARYKHNKAVDEATSDYRVCEIALAAFKRRAA